eukprot:1372501-Rhodomonas_salina.1
MGGVEFSKTALFVLLLSYIIDFPGDRIRFALSQKFDPGTRVPPGTAMESLYRNTRCSGLVFFLKYLVWTLVHNRNLPRSRRGSIANTSVVGIPTPLARSSYR